MKSHLRITIDTLLKSGTAHREIERRTVVDRKTIRRYARAANSPGVATGFAGRGDQIPPTPANQPTILAGHLTRHTQPEIELKLLLERLKPTLPAQPPPKITAAQMTASAPV